MKLVIVCLCLVPLCTGTFNKFDSGDCPTIDHMPNFHVDQFLGEWFVVENYNDNNVACLKETFSASNDLDDSRKTTLELDNAKYEVEASVPLADHSIELADKHDRARVYKVKRTYLPFGSTNLVVDEGNVLTNAVRTSRLTQH